MKRNLLIKGKRKIIQFDDWGQGRCMMVKKRSYIKNNLKHFGKSLSDVGSDTRLIASQGDVGMMTINSGNKLHQFIICSKFDISRVDDDVIPFFDPLIEAMDYKTFVEGDISLNVGGAVLNLGLIDEGIYFTFDKDKIKNNFKQLDLGNLPKDGHISFARFGEFVMSTLRSTDGGLTSIVIHDSIRNEDLTEGMIDSLSFLMKFRDEDSEGITVVSSGWSSLDSI